MFKRIKPEKKTVTNSTVDPDSGIEAGSMALAASSRLVLVREKPSVISEGCAIEGAISSESILLLDGRFNGTIGSEGLTVGKSGRVQGKVTCKVLHIKGYMAGEAACEELVVDATAVIKADISYKRLKVARGAVISGTLTSGRALTVIRKKARVA